MRVESSQHYNLFRWIVNDWNSSNVRIREPYMLFTSCVHQLIGPSHFVISVKPFIGFTLNLTGVFVMELLGVLLVLLNGISSVSFLWFGKNIARIKDDSTMHCGCLDLRKLYILNIYDDIIKWKHFRATGPLCVESRWIPCTKVSDAELWCFLWICAWINRWVTNREAGDLKRHRAHYDVIVMYVYRPDIIQNSVWSSQISWNFRPSARKFNLSYLSMPACICNTMAIFLLLA